MENSNTPTTQVVETTTKRKGSTTLTIKAFNGSIKRLEELKMINEKELETLKKIKKDVFERWQSIEMNM